MTRKHRFAGLWVLFAFFVVSAANGDTVFYSLTFESTWSEETHPGAFPPAAHYSGTTGATHTSDVSFWAPGGLATPGIKRVAELGSRSVFSLEILTAIEDGTAFAELRLPGVSTSPRTVAERFQASSTHPLVTFVNMIAPSPDWIVGIHDVSLLDEDGNWIPEMLFEAIPYDAGTDSGVDFTSSNLVTSPFEPISRITGAPFDGDRSGPLGTFTLTLESLPGDVDASGEIDAGDITALCSRLGESHPAFELTGDNTIGIDDVNELVERVMGTRAGDANLDGRVNVEDFLTLSRNFNGATDWSGGDFDCNGEVQTNDFLILSRHFGFNNNGGDTTAVAAPEPDAVGLAALALLGLCSVRTGRRPLPIAG